VNRFLKVATLLIISLFLLVSGVNTTLDCMTHASSQNSFTMYNAKGEVILAYDGTAIYTKPYPKVTPAFMHRTSGSESDLPTF